MSTPSYLETNDASLVRLIKDGAIFIRDRASNPTAPSSSAWTPGVNDTKIGYYSEDGYTLTPVPGDSTDFAAHNGDIVISDQAPGWWTLAFSGLEGNESNAETYFDVTVGGDGSVTLTTAAANKHYDIVIVGLDQNDNLIVAHFPDVKVSEREGIVFNRTTLLAYAMTFRTFKGPASAPYHFKAWGLVVEATLPPAPEVTGATPAAAEADAEVTITGTNFTGATRVQFGASNAASYTVVSDTEITAVMPAGSAGSAAIKVTTPGGESNSFAYTRG